MVKILTSVSKNVVECKITGKLRRIKNPHFSITYPIDVSDTPLHLINFMWGIILSEHLS